MLKFQRNKLVSIFQDNPDELRIHGLLDDHIFGLEIDVMVRIDDSTIHFIDGKWNREETPECSRAVPFLQAAMGFKTDSKNLPQQINKVVSRQSCPHFAIYYWSAARLHKRPFKSRGGSQPGLTNQNLRLKHLSRVLKLKQLKNSPPNQR